jgi:hypothetical protein
MRVTLSEGSNGFDRALQDINKVDALLPERDLSKTDAGNVQRIVEKPRELVDLARDGLRRSKELGVRGF